MDGLGWRIFKIYECYEPVTTPQTLNFSTTLTKEGIHLDETIVQFLCYLHLGTSRHRGISNQQDATPGLNRLKYTGGG